MKKINPITIPDHLSSTEPTKGVIVSKITKEILFVWQTAHGEFYPDCCALQNYGSSVLKAIFTRDYPEYLELLSEAF